MLELKVKTRQAKGRQNEKLRKQGTIPAVLYGHKIKNLLLEVRAADFDKIYKQAGESTLLKLKIEGEDKEKVVLIYDTEVDPVNEKTIHIDFYQVKMDEALKTEVPLVFIGESPLIKNEGGVLVKNIQHLEIEALPQDLIHNIEVDTSILRTFDDNIRVKDLKIPEKVKISANPEEMVAVVIPPRTQQEIEGLEEKPAVEGIEEIKVAGKEEKEGEEAAPAESEKQEQPVEKKE
jgi:large subunit ribosomal protein L25